MTREELLNLVNDLEPSSRDIAEALAFLRLVVNNNQQTPVAEIVSRPDVRSALEVIDKWIEDSTRVVDSFAAELPKDIESAIGRQAVETLNKIEDETRINETNVNAWKTNEESEAQWGAKLLLRMQWFVDWLRKQIESLLLGAPYKRWVSRLAPNTCRFCRALHGTVVPAGKSFASAAKSVGFTRLYAGLYAPPLHPQCQCIVEGVQTLTG